LLAGIYVLLIGVIVGLIGWIEQSYIKVQWTWYATDRPFLAANMWPYVLTAGGRAGAQARSQPEFQGLCVQAAGQGLLP